MSISSIFLFKMEEWSTGAVCEACLRLAIKSPGHCLDVALVSLLVAFNDFHILFLCFVCDFDQVFVYRYILSLF